MFKLGTITRSSFLILLLSSSLAHPSNIAYAQSSGGSWWEDVWRRLTRRPGEDERTGSAGGGGANRDRCPYTTEELIAIIPVAATNGIPYEEKTISGYPTWWFYVPYAGSGNLQSEFVLIGSDEQIIYREKSSIPEAPGILKVSWPESESPLAQGRRYRWVFSIVCNPVNPSGSATVNGWIRRVSSEEADLLSNNSDQQSYFAYADSLYWFDLLSEIDRRRSEEPEVFDPLWDGILCQVYSQSPRLENLAESCEALSSLELPQPD